MLLQPNENGDYVNITDWTAQPVDDLLGQIEWHADVLRGATLYDLESIMAPAWELARRVEAAEAKLAESATRLAELAAALAAALAAQQWRPVTEKPEQPDTYLVYRGGAAHNEPWRYDFAVWEDAWDTEAFSHWRPLPPTPAETTP